LLTVNVTFDTTCNLPLILTKFSFFPYNVTKCYKSDLIKFPVAVMIIVNRFRKFKFFEISFLRKEFDSRTSGKRLGGGKLIKVKTLGYLEMEEIMNKQYYHLSTKYTYNQN